MGGELFSSVRLWGRVAALSRRGVALVTVLSLGVLLMILTAAVVAFVLPHYRAHWAEQQKIQAYWNARSGLESYLAGTIGPIQSGKALEFDDGSVTRQKNVLVFEGRSGRAHSRLVLREGSQP